MLNLVLGRAGSGKTEFVFSKIKNIVENEKSDIVLLTPEQFSFISERRLLSGLGESKVNRVSNLSFSRLSNEISRLYGGNNLPVLTKGARAVMMKKAIQTVSDGLVLFNKNTSSNSFINSALKIYDEMKSCRVFVKDIISASEKVEKEMLSLKLKDIALIIDAYDSLIDGVYFDSENELTRLYEKLLRIDYFKNKTVFIDGFSGFVAQEYKILEVILNQADEVYITFCTDNNFSDKNTLFSYVNSNINILKDVAKKVGCEIREEIILSGNKRANNDELKAVEEFALSNISYEDTKEPENITLFSAKNISDECDNTAKEISKLLRSGYLAKDITVICRDLNKYQSELQFSFDKYNIPYFNDERQNISSQPLIMLVNFLMRAVIYSLRSEDIFSMLKTGLTKLDDENISLLENYAFVWNISGSKWKNDFSESPRGFTEEISEKDKNALETLNQSRKYIIDIIIKFKKRCFSANAEDICKAIYYALVDLSVDEKLKELAISLDESGKSHLSLQQERIWDLLMEILDKLAVTGGKETINLKDFYMLFSLMISNEDLGSVPAGLDNVQIGSADRIRCDNPRAIFVLGANEGEFPQSVTSAGLLSENDRTSLINNDFKLYSYGAALNAQELYFAYMALSSAREKLFVSYISGGEKNNESIIVRGLQGVFVNSKINLTREEKTIDDIQSEENAFEILASDFNDNTPFVASLKEYFSNNEKYQTRLSAVKKLIDNDEIIINDKELAKKLFKKDMYLSASRIEDYFNCSFRYFCKFGLNARPLMKAQMDPMQTGTVIHFVLETIIKEKGSKGLAELSKEETVILVNNALKEYLTEKMGNSDEFTPRFKYQFMRLSKMIVFVVERLKEEFSQSDFEAKAFELRIGDGEEVHSKEIKLDDGGSIRIKGAVDRVDTFEKDGKKYIRVVDYKSGNKEFQMSDIINGLNLQMFIYLFTLSQSKGEFGGISSGVLYMHSARGVYSLDRNNTSEIAKKENTDFKMKGVVLNDEENEIAPHMEKDLKGKYIPVKYSAKDGYSGNIVSLAQLGAVSKKIDSLIKQMGSSLHRGLISQNPVDGKHHNRTCQFCDYQDVCSNRSEIVYKELEELSNSEAIEIIEKESENA
ncbi:MAG: PD-(D/E)XK nuclease family protein [Eubacterium sp.]|nr:PD-(D/E)XK nuclease family protein [Eubacterium sp.]